MDRYIELAPKYWLATRARLVASELDAELGALTIPAPIPATEKHEGAYSPVPGSLFGTLLIAKYLEGLPLFRIEQRLDREGPPSARAASLRSRLLLEAARGIVSIL